MYHAIKISKTFEEKYLASSLPYQNLKIARKKYAALL